MDIKAIINFYSELALNNDKLWFDAHKAEYKALKADFDAFAADMITRMGKLDPDIKGLAVKDCTYRIYRDVRFSPDKSPYKTFISLWMPKGGKKGPYAGYYLHIDPFNCQYFIAAGSHLLTPMLLKSVREDIMLDGAGFDARVKAAKGFELDWNGALRRLPAGWPADSPFADYFRLKDYLLMKKIDLKYLTARKLEDRLEADLARCVPFVKALNRAIDFAIEEWGAR